MECTITQSNTAGALQGECLEDGEDGHEVVDAVHDQSAASRARAQHHRHPQRRRQQERDEEAQVQQRERRVARRQVVGSYITVASSVE